ncbi:sacsin [Syngnathoides biaculeatus]|uniref:sacsin n=1 Tax=Syngnathoides biaculeatus TaxID=300417 RepID=UPI002ADDBB48|nr:sacsin [Syngnathoides biaculeatus]XP_061697751.1 sacsin [Syngnathoides biaculeatus]XP_061697752.1 sacsin [Syngnathoides biaculeatus]XP_061697754.1 sacsin [Syngnathoides biaculeatus]
MSMSSKKKTRTSFGATAPPFIDYLKDILRRYPDGGQILKELIQNADDAQATKVTFIHDERSYGTQNLWTDALGCFQGPALYSYNNAPFTNEDWQGIQAVGRSIKRKDPTTVGRFGIGFNSVYHITDVPSIFSSGHLAFLDPQEKLFGERQGGFRWSLDDTEHQEALTTMADQFQPFRDVVKLVSGKEWSKVINHDQHFDGTIFRLPLRAETSEISDNLYNANKVAELFGSFFADADLSLLFLKNVTTVSLMHVDVHGSVSTRLEVKSSASAGVILEPQDKTVIEGSTGLKVITVTSEEHKETKWLVTTCTVKEENIEELDILAQKLSFVPRVDLAFPCGERGAVSGGRLCCFLPLPNNDGNKTGLPVHVNACFGLTDNRRHIKWQEEDQIHDEQAVWNELLMKAVLPQAYRMIVRDAIGHAQETFLPASSVYDLLPDLAEIQHKDKWYALAVDVLRQLFQENVPVLSLARDEKKFISPSEAVLPCTGPVRPDILAAVRKTLLCCGENLVTSPSNVARAIEKVHPRASSLKYATPAFLRDVLHRVDVRRMSRDDKLCLLEFILSDGEYQDLRGLELLPLSDGSFRAFTDKDQDTALIDSKEFPRVLLPFCEDLFIPDDLSPDCTSHLKELALQKLFKIIVIDADQVAQYIRKYLPEDWKLLDKDLVSWDINKSLPRPIDWLQEFWKFLNAHFTALNLFVDIPLIPVGPLSSSQSVQLAKMNPKTTLVFHQRRQISLPDEIAKLVTKVGGTVVRGNEWLKHDDLDSYVLCPSPRSIVTILTNVEYHHLVKELETTCPSAREELKEYLSSLNSLSNSERDILSKVPLFQNTRGVPLPALSKKALLIGSGPKVPMDLPMPDSIVQCITDADRSLLQLLNIKLLDTAQAAHLLIDKIESRTCSKKDSEKIMIWILQHSSILFSQNKNLKHRCREFGFMEANGVLKKTSHFLDPRVPIFKVIFDASFFPPSPYLQTAEMIETLTELGMRKSEADVSPEHLLHAAAVIDGLQMNSETFSRAQALFNMLDAHNLLPQFSDAQLQKLKMLKWVPCANPGSKADQFSLFCPHEIRHSQYEDLVGYVMPLMGSLSDRVSNELGLKRLPPPEKVRDNLFVLTANTEKMADPDTNEDFRRRLHSIYKHMQDHISDFATLIDGNVRWLWCGDRFFSPRDLVLDYPPNIDLSLWVRKLPKEFLPYKKLLEEFGLRLLLLEHDIVNILHSIMETIEGRRPATASPSEIKVSVEIVKWIWKEKMTVQEDIPVPVITHGGQQTLKSLSTAVFCDLSKKGLEGLQYSKEQVHLLHDEIPKAAAEWLNIQFLSTHILHPELVGIEQCGQSEPITMRIKNILKEYDEEMDVFKELIQNAEDAGAETCKFLVDFRIHKSTPENLIDPGMALCQGPCLWAFNNEKFTSDDWDNIVRVGSASKERKVGKIGKFGLGFNTVYHITDVPSVLSGNRLLILDPNVTHLKKIIRNKSNPGIKLDLSQKQLFHFFHDQFRPYENIFDCNFTTQCPPEPYQGTLIKLPFRTEEEALKSGISTKVYDKHNIVSFQREFTNDSQTHILFLKNLKTLSLQNISNQAATPPRDEELQTVFTVTKSTLSKIGIADVFQSRQLQAEKSLLNHGENCKEVIDCCAANIVQISSEQSGRRQSQPWLVYNCFGTKQSLKMALQDNKQTKFSLPIGGIAVPLQKGPESANFTTAETKSSGQAFCFLPLPIHTGLPVLVNGTFAVTSNRKGLWESGVKREWNKALLQDSVVTAYVTALLVLKDMSQNGQLESYSYHTFWPDREKVCDTFKPLVDSFYSIITQHCVALEVFCDGQKWCSVNNAIFLHESIEEDEKIHTLVTRVCQKHIKAPNLVVPLPRWLRNSFTQGGFEKVVQEKTWNWERFYQDVVFENLATLDAKSRDALLLHAIDLNSEGIDHLLGRYPCIPAMDGQLQHIDKLVNPSGKLARLFEDELGRLLGGTENDFRSSKRVQRLLKLGMADDHLPMEAIVQKAATIQSIWKTDKNKAYVYLKGLLELMKDHIFDRDSSHWKTLSMTPFLPAFHHSGKKKVLRRPVEIFSEEYSLLVNKTQPVLDHSGLNIHISDPILQILGIRDSPVPDIVFQQLEKAEKSQHTDKSEILKIADECYRFLDSCICDSKMSELICQRANSFPFIFDGKTFVNVSRVAVKGQFEAKPYLHVLPPGFASFQKLWRTVGVEDSFTLDQFVAVLQEIHLKHGNNPLPKDDLGICLSILNRGIYSASENVTSACLIPNEEGVLVPASQVFFNDSPWMPVSADVMLCHKDIPRAMALHFGIKTTKHHTLQNVAKNLPPHSFQFEQKEELTVRIKNIISAYPSKMDILKELIQNADDAEATEIHFVWDRRQHGTEKTFGENWNRLQGPALCVFNNRVFSDTDLAGIQQLGTGGKRHNPGKIGKYGLGFTSVFHLTDCPSILTGDSLLCISDPNQNYIESEHVGAGIGYTLNETLKEMFEDVYKSYLPDKFPLKDGTMIRLPLRTVTMAETSKISHWEVCEKDLETLCAVLTEDPEGLILFLRNISKIVVHEINRQSEEITTTFAVEKKTTQAKEEREASVWHPQNDVPDEDSVTRKAIYETMISTSKKRQSTWIVAEQFRTFQSNNGEVKHPQATVAACVRSEGPRDYSVFKGRVFCLLPLPGTTGLPVHINGDFVVDSARKGLWRQDGQSLKANWNESLKNNVIAPLYADLLHYISRTTFEKTVSAAKMESYFTKSYFRFWPTVSEDVSQEWQEMVHGVYRSMSERGLKVIPVLRSTTRVTPEQQLTTPTEYCIDWRDVSETTPTTAPYMESSKRTIDHILRELGMDLVPFTTETKRIWDGFRSAGIDVKDVNPSSVRIFLSRKAVHNPKRTSDALPLPVSDTLVKNPERCSKLLHFCLSDICLENITGENPALLNGLPLLLTADEVLRVFDYNSPKLMCKYSHLFSGYESNFVHHQTNREHDKVLKALGLASDLTVPGASDWLKLLIQQNLSKCEVDPQHHLTVPNKEMIAWLKLLWKFLLSNMKAKKIPSGDKDLTLTDVKQLFGDFCILPVVCPRSNKHFLQKLQGMASVIRFQLDKDISGILFKLGFMKFDIAFFIEFQYDKYSVLEPEFMNLNDKTSVLDQVVLINHSEFAQLSSDDMTELQNFLQSGESKKCPEYQRKLRSLPLFETIQGNRVRIDGQEAVYILDMLAQSFNKFPDLFKPPDCHNIFLKNNPENISVSQTLKIQTLNDLQYFMKLILPVVRRLTKTQKIQCLKLLLSLQLSDSYLEHKSTIISQLETVPIIANANGEVVTVSYYFDDRVALYRAMLPRERFVPASVWTELCEGKQYKEQPARQLLQELGMNHVVSKDDIIRFAKDLESEIGAKGHSQELEQKSTLVFQEALSVARDEKILLKSITNIKFIFPVKVKKKLCDYHLPFVPETTAVQINGSLIENGHVNQELIWSSMPIIDLPLKTEELLKMITQVGAHERPPAEFVARNLFNVCRSPCETDVQIQTRATVFRSSYAYLQAINFDSQSLKGLPLVLVEKDKKVVRTENVARSLPHDSDFRPYLYKLPNWDIVYWPFFQKVGVKEEPTALQYCNVLSAVNADSSAKTRLNGNQQGTVKRAVQQLLLLMKKKCNQSLLESVKTLYLPAVDGKLHPSCALYFNDTAFDPQRLEASLEEEFLLLEKLSACHLGTDIYDHCRILQLLPQRLQPQMLSQVTSEKVVESHMQVCDIGLACEFRGWFDNHLTSGAFTHGLICLIREQSKGKITQEAAADMCKKIFGSIEIVCCTSLMSELWLQDRALKNTACETDVFVQQDQKGSTFYLRHNDTMLLKVINEVNMTLTKVINSLLGGRILPEHLLVLGQLLLCDDLQDVRKTLAKNGIHDSVDVQSFPASTAALKGDIPEEWHDCLDMNVLNNFETGECVGYFTNNKYIYATIVEELPGQAGPYSQRYKIRIGEDELIEVSSVDLYQFKCENNPQTESDPSRSIGMDLQEMTFQYSSSWERSLPGTYEEAVTEINQSLAEIWTLPQEERTKPGKRLYLKWHNFKNPQCHYVSEAVEYVKRRTCVSFGVYYHQWDEEALRHRSSREQFVLQHHSYNFWGHNKYIPRPNRGEARRWCRQARCDLGAARNESGEGSAEWCLFKLHQAVEKSLIAAEYKKNGRRLGGTISAMAGKMSDFSPRLGDLPLYVAELQALGVDAKKTQYPDCHPFPRIPNESFHSADLGAALDTATQLLDAVETYVD